MTDSSHTNASAQANNRIDDSISIRNAVENAAENISQSASSATEQIKDEGVSFLSRQKVVAADQLGHLSKAVHKAADSLRTEQDATLADYAEFVADGMDRVSNRLRTTSLEEAMQACQEAARRRPELVYGGMLLAGLFVSRFLRIASNRPA